MDSASMGTSAAFASKVKSGSYTCCMMMQTRSAGVDMMSSVGGSATMARLSADLPDWASAGTSPPPEVPRSSNEDKAVRRRMRIPRVMENSRGEGISGVKGKSRKFLHFQEKPEEIGEILK